MTGATTVACAGTGPRALRSLPPARHHRQRCAATLVEVVIIAVIVILLALLILPLRQHVYFTSLHQKCGLNQARE